MIALPGLAAYVRSGAPVAVAARCELCGAPLGREHRHVVEPGVRGLQCACQACALLFAREDAATPFRTVPDRVLVDPAFAMSAAAWAALGVPVSLAFFVRSRGAVGVYYPGPAGVTDAELADDAWQALAAATPLVAALADDVEALLVRGDRGGPLACYVVPITAAFELAGRLRASWRGFSGGDDAQRELSAYFAELETRGARP